MRSRSADRPSWGLRVAAFAGLAFMGPRNEHKGAYPLVNPRIQTRGPCHAR
jgi:hypothetical protein